MTGFKVSIESNAQVFTGRLLRSGVHRFQTVGGSVVEFCSTPTYLGIEDAEMKEFKTFTGNQTERIHGLSPFSQWTLIADDTVPNDLLAHFQKFTLTFMGNSRASSN